VLARLRALGAPCILGNHDEFMLEPASIHGYTDAPPVLAAVAWCRAQLAPEDLALLRTFVRAQRFELGAGASLLAYHGSPASNVRDLLAETPAAELDAALENATPAATVYAGGHTHVQMLRQHRGALVVNPGSVGMPFREYVGGRAPTLLHHAEYATVEANEDGGVAVTLHRVPLDLAALRAQLRESDNPISPLLLAQYS
jgi:predicted phosphodiesterase